MTQTLYIDDFDFTGAKIRFTPRFLTESMDVTPLVGGQTGDEIWVAFWDQDRFITREVKIKNHYNNNFLDIRNKDRNVHWPEFPRDLLLYYPLDQRLIRSDIDGATIAYPNAEGTGWLFAHTDEGTHHDYELTAIAACDGVFQPVFRQYQADSYSAKVETQRETAKDRYVLLAEFYGQVNAALRKQLRATYLGEREQQPHPSEGWIDRDITAAVSAVKAKWKADSRTADLTSIAGGLTYIENALAMPSVETRWDRAKRLADEAKKQAEAEAEAQTSGD